MANLHQEKRYLSVILIRITNLQTYIIFLTKTRSLLSYDVVLKTRVDKVYIVYTEPAIFATEI